MFHYPTPCDDELCYECYWVHASEIKHIFQVSETSWDAFIDDLHQAGALEWTRFVDGSTYLHKSLDLERLGHWIDYMHFLDPLPYTD